MLSCRKKKKRVLCEDNVQRPTRFSSRAATKRRGNEGRIRKAKGETYRGGKKNDEKKMVKGNNNSNQTNKQTEKKCSLVTKAKCRRADLSGVYTIHAELRFLALMMVVQVQKM